MAVRTQDARLKKVRSRKNVAAKKSKGGKVSTPVPRPAVAGTGIPMDVMTYAARLLPTPEIADAIDEKPF